MPLTQAEQDELDQINNALDDAKNPNANIRVKSVKTGQGPVDARAELEDKLPPISYKDSGATSGLTPEEKAELDQINALLKPKAPLVNPNNSLRGEQIGSNRALTKEPGQSTLGALFQDRQKAYDLVEKSREASSFIGPDVAEKTRSSTLGVLAGALLGHPLEGVALFAPTNDLESSLSAIGPALEGLVSVLGKGSLPIIQKVTGKNMGAIKADVESSVRPFNKALSEESGLGKQMDELFHAIASKKKQIGQVLDKIKENIRMATGEKPIATSTVLKNDAYKLLYNNDTKKVAPIYKTVSEILTLGDGSNELPFNSLHDMKQSLQDLVSVGYRRGDDKIIKSIGEEKVKLLEFIKQINKTLENEASKALGSPAYTEYNRKYSSLMNGADEVIRTLFSDYPSKGNPAKKFSKVLFEGGPTKRMMQTSSRQTAKAGLPFFDEARRRAISIELGQGKHTGDWLNIISNLAFKPSTLTGIARRAINPGIFAKFMYRAAPSILERLATQNQK